MPRIICRYDVCVFNKDNQCTAKEMEYDPDQGCLTAQDRDEFDGLLDDEDEFDEEDDELEADELDGDLDDEEDDEDELFEDGDLEEELDEDDEF